jgi:SAM-dependent methyltransferase
MTTNDPKGRFSDRVEDYDRYRPTYPDAVLDLLVEHCELGPKSVVADIGSGTGILSAKLLQHSARVHSLEPNDPMRARGDKRLREFEHSRSHPTSAEETGLPNASVDLITAAQAFHWFDQERCHKEWRRILRPAGHVALLWNDRRTTATPFLTAYENHLKEHSVDYGRVHHRRITPAALERFFSPGVAQTACFTNEQVFDYEGLRGRHLSCSYVPNTEHPGFPAMVTDLRRLFDTYQTEGTVRFEYDTQVFFGPLCAAGC